MGTIDIAGIYTQELAQCGGDTAQALMGTRTRVHEALQAEAGDPPHLKLTRGMSQTQTHPGVPPSATAAQHAAQTAHHLDLWSKADELIRSASLHDPAHDAHVAPQPAEIEHAALAGQARMVRGGSN